MKNEAMQKYEQNSEEIAMLEGIGAEADEAFKKMKAEYEAKKEELSNSIDYLKRQNQKIAQENYVFSFGDVVGEIARVAKEHGYKYEPEVIVYLSAMISNSGKQKAKAKTVEECREYLEKEEELYLKHPVLRRIRPTVNVNIRKPKHDDGAVYRFYATKKLDFDMLMCDGSRLQDNLYTQVKFDNILGCYYTKLLLEDGAAEMIPVVVDPTNYPKVENENNDIVLEAFATLIERRNAERQENSTTERNDI